MYKKEDWKYNRDAGLYSKGSIQDIQIFDGNAITFCLKYHTAMRSSFNDDAFTEDLLTTAGVIRITFHNAQEGLTTGRYSHKNTRMGSCSKGSGTYVGVSLEKEYYETCIKPMCNRFSYSDLFPIPQPYW
jgi:hypothetical protein